MEFPDEGIHSCVSGLVDIQNSFLSSHRHLSILVCTLGFAANTLAVAVLTHKAVTTPTNLLLTGRALAELFANVLYLVGMCSTPGAFKVVPVLDLISAWLTVAAAASWSMRRALAVTLSACVLAPLLSTPLFLTYCVKILPSLDGDYETGSEEIHHIPVVNPPPDVGDRDDQALVDVVHWIYGVIFKVVPCVVLVTLWKMRQQRSLYSTSDEATQKTPANLLRLLFSIFIVFQLTQATLNAVNLTFNDYSIYKSCKFFFDILDLLNLLNRSLVFILFFTMSALFRKILMHYLKSKFLNCFPIYFNDATLSTSFKRC